MELISYCRGIPRASLGSFVVMESYHNEVPMTITNVPSNPCRGVGVEDQRQQDYIGYDHDGAGQQDHQANKHLTEKVIIFICKAVFECTHPPVSTRVFSCTEKLKRFKLELKISLKITLKSQLISHAVL